MPDHIRPVLLPVPSTVLVVASCSASGEPGGDSAGCDAIPGGEDRVVIGFWDTPECSGDPLTTNSFPVESDADCYCWPGNSGQNSAMSFSCNGGDGSFTYDQYSTPVCGSEGASPTTRTSFTTECKQHIPPTLHSRIVDYEACEASR